MRSAHLIYGAASLGGAAFIFVEMGMNQQEAAEAIRTLQGIIKDLSAGKGVAYAVVALNADGICQSGLRCPNGSEAHINWGLHMLQHILTTGCVQGHQAAQPVSGFVS